MKDKIKKALETKYKNLGFGEKAFEGVAAYLEPSIKDEATIETAIAGVDILLKAFQSDTDRVRTEKSELAKKYAEMEAKIKALGGEHEPKDEPTPTDMTAREKALFDRIEKLTGVVEGMQKNTIADTRKSQLNKIIEALPADLQKPYLRINVDSLKDEAFTALIEEITPEVQGLVVKTQSAGAVFTTPIANVNPTDDKPSEYMAARRAQKEAEAKAQAPTVKGI